VSNRLSPPPYSSYSSAVPISDGIDDLATILRSVDVDPERSFAEWLGRGGRLTPDFKMGQLGIADSRGVIFLSVKARPLCGSKDCSMACCGC
jgi:hypothetical protein